MMAVNHLVEALQMSAFKKFVRFQFERREVYLAFLERLRRAGKYDWLKRAHRRYAIVYTWRYKQLSPS